MAWSFRKLTSSVSIAALLVLAAAGAESARASVFTVREVHSSSGSIDSLSKATQLLNGTLPSAGESSTSTLVINYADPQSPSKGRFGDEVEKPVDAAFPGDTAGDDNNFALIAEANIVIPTAGHWTFGVNADNGLRLRVGSFVMSRSGFDTATLLNTFNFPAAGTYALQLTYYEHTGQSGVEVFAAEGTITNRTDDAFRLVGDATNGGLTVAPEPVGVLPLAIFASALLARRWRRV